MRFRECALINIVNRDSREREREVWASRLVNDGIKNGPV